jgi:hypothetical protein
MGNGSGGNIHWLSNLATETPVWIYLDLGKSSTAGTSPDEKGFFYQRLPAVSNMVPP